MRKFPLFGLGSLLLAGVLAMSAPARAAPTPRRPARSPAAAPPRKKARATARPAPTRPTRPKPAKDEDDQSDEELLRNLEQDAEAQPKKRRDAQPTGGRVQRFIQSMNPEISAILSLAGAYYYDHGLGGKGSVVPGGGHDPGKSGFHFQELELAFQAAVDPYFRMAAFLSVSMHGVHVEEAYFSTVGLGAGFKIRAGVLYQKFGRFNTQHLHIWKFVDSMVPVVRLLGAEGLGGVSGEVSWLMPLPWYSNLSVSLLGPAGKDSFVGEGARKNDFELKDPRHLLYVFHWAQFFELSDDWGMSLGLSYAVGPNNSGGYVLNMTQLFGADLFLKWRPLRRPYTEIQFTTEWYGRLAQIPEDQLFDWGLYAQLAFRLAKRWFLALRYDMVEIQDSAGLARFAFVEPSTDAEHPSAVDDQQRGSVSLYWQPTHFSQIRIQYNNNWVRRVGADGLPGEFKMSHGVFLQLQGNIGAHGAHPY